MSTLGCSEIAVPQDLVKEKKLAKLTVKDLQQMKADKKKIVASVVYEAQMTQMMERAGADVLSVGDSLGRAFLAHTEEFYEWTTAHPSVAGLTPALREWEHVYNSVRPHQALDYLTPVEFLHANSQRKEEVSLR